MRLGLVILDWAGTVIDHGALAPTVAAMKAFAARGIAITPAEIQAFLGLTPPALTDALLTDANIRWRWSHRHGGRLPTLVDAQRLTGDLFPRLMEAIEEHDTLIAGTVESADEIRRRGCQI